MLKAFYKKHTLHFKKPGGTSRGVLREKDSWFLVVYDDQAPEKKGIGECSIIRRLSIDDRPDFEQKLSEVAGDINRHAYWLEEGLTEFPSIRFGLETALKDLNAEIPRILFPSGFTAGKESIPINGLVWMGSFEEMSRQIKEKVEQGFRCIKLKIGAIDFDEELTLLKGIRREFPEKDMELRVDANGAFSPEEALIKLHEGLSKKGCTKRYEKILERIGRLKQKNTRISQEYDIDVVADDEKKNAIKINWNKLDKANEKDSLSGVYCLRSNVMQWSEETLWNTYVMLTDLEATFRSMKTELGLRPVYHQKEERVTAHLLITLLAYHLVHTLRYQLKQQGIHLSWESIRQIMSRQQRLTISMPTQEQTQIFVRTTTQAETQQKKIYEALNINPDPIGKQKTIVEK